METRNFIEHSVRVPLLTSSMDKVVAPGLFAPAAWIGTVRPVPQIGVQDRRIETRVQRDLRWVMRVMRARKPA